MKKNGFTLIELLAVIVILAIILAIAVPSISSMIGNAARSSFTSDVKMVLKQLDYEKLKNEGFDITAVNEDTISGFGLSNENYQDLKVGIIDNKPYIVAIGKGKWNGYKACGTYQNIVVVDNSDMATCENITDSNPPMVYTYYDTAEGVNKPVLANGMTPIKWDGTTWIETVETDADWYNYTATDKKWANARTSDGSMWVWIPRYIYKISSGWHSTTSTPIIDIQFTRDMNDNWNSSVINNINTGTTADSSNGTWTNHPAFTFGTTELSGIWVSKFEASGTSSAPTFISSVASLRNINISNMFLSARGMETNEVYGWGTTGTGIDTHMMKNVEWGAVTYLAESTYGKDAEVWINQSSSFMTGCAGASAGAGYTSGCQYSYATANGQQASTTGNIYGIYDMSGGTWEYTAAYVNNTPAATYGSSIVNADSKYKDVYEVGISDTAGNNYAVALYKKGDALYETSASTDSVSAWYTAYSYMVRTNEPWCVRGGEYGNTTSAGIFAFHTLSGTTFAYAGFRSILLIAPGL
jgi:prepilin-type N-terminal cleavage/methylation domain-containing protein